MIASLRQSGILAALLLTYVRRRVLRIGAMRSPAVRLAVVTGVGGFVVVIGAAAYLFLRDLGPEADEWGLLFEVATTSVVMWTAVAFLVIKVLFMSSGGLLQLTSQLPLTGRERAVGLLMYEVLLTAAVSSAGVVGLIAGAVGLLGAAAVAPLLVSVVLPALMTYAVLSVVWTGGSQVLGLVGVRRVRPLLLVAVVGLLLVGYLRQLPGLTAQLTGDYLDGRSGTTWVGWLSGLAERYGTPVALGVGAVVVALLLACAVRLTPGQHVPQARFIRLPVPARWAATSGPYTLCAVRSTQTAIALLTTTALTAVLVVDGGTSPAWAVSVMSLPALYQFAATAPLRRTAVLRRAPARTYWSLLRAQLLVVTLVAVPVAALSLALDPGSGVTVAKAVVSALLGAFVALAVGIGFPAEDDNPFSVVLGLTVCLTVVGLGAIALGVLQLPPVAMTVAGVLAVAGISLYSINSIDLDERNNHNEDRTSRIQQPGRSSGSDDGDLGSYNPRSHVYDG